MQRCHKERDECLFSVKYSFGFCSVLQTDFSVQLLHKLLTKLAFFHLRRNSITLETGEDSTRLKQKDIKCFPKTL